MRSQEALDHNFAFLMSIRPGRNLNVDRGEIYRETRRQIDRSRKEAARAREILRISAYAGAYMLVTGALA